MTSDRPSAGRSRRRFIVAGVLAVTLVVGACSQPGPETLTVFAASSLADVLADLEEDFETSHPGADVVVSLGATSMLARQIERGAPADVFLSASPEWTDTLAARNALLDPVQTVIGNRLVVVGRNGMAPLAVPDDLRRFDRIAVADPEGVPAGVYAREALERAGLWDDLEPRLVPTLDVRAAVAAVQTGAVPVALAYASDAIGTDVDVVLEWPPSSAPVIRYTAAVPQGAAHPYLAREFIAFVTQPERLAVWRRHGFAPLADPARP